MKPIQLTTLLLAACLWQGCGIIPQTPTTNMTILFDHTDSIENFPTAQMLLSPFDLANNKFQGIKIVFTALSDLDINPRTIIELKPENELTSNIVERNNAINAFTEQVRHALDSMRTAPTALHSIVYRAIAREANALASSHADNKFLLVYSNGYENNGDINFYRPNEAKLLRRHPDSIAKQLIATEPLRQLNGVQVFLLYKPLSFSDNYRFTPVADLYKSLFVTHGAIFTAAAQFARP